MQNTAQDAPQIEMIPRAQIYPNPNQPRKAFDAGEMEQLRASIADHGIMQPLEVMRAPNRFDGAPYRIIFGERRWRASEGVADALPCIVADISQDEADERMMNENFQRNDLTAERGSGGRAALYGTGFVGRPDRATPQ